MESEFLQIGGLAAIFALAIREFFSYIKTKKNEKENGDNCLNKNVLAQLELMNSNHLHSIETAIREGNEKIVDAITNGNIRTAQLLGEIKGHLEK